MDTIILGTKPLFEKAKQLLGGFENLNIVSFFELQKWEEAAEIRQMYWGKVADTLILAVPNQNAEEITALLRDADIRNIFYIPHYAYNLKHVSLDEILVRLDVNKPRLCYLEFMVCDHCNLNCKGCTHYCNIEEEVFADFNSYFRDLKRLKELFWGISKIRLMGGEPLLNEKLYKFVDVTREVFPDAEIRVVTNGLLIPGINKELAASMKRSHCGFDITLYEPTANILGKITKTLDEYEIERNISKKVVKFLRIKTFKPINNPEKASERCRSRNCHFLMDGHLAKCTEPILVEKLNKRYLTDFTSKDIHNIYNKNIDAWELNKQLDSPIDFCRYCVPFPEKFRWERCAANNAKLEDWIIPAWKVPFFSRRPPLKRAVKKMLLRIGFRS